MADYKNRQSKKASKNITLKLSRDEALVLFEWLSQFNEAENSTLFQDEAEQRVLFDLEATLEHEMTEVFDSKYSDILLAARKNVRDKV